MSVCYDSYGGKVSFASLNLKNRDFMFIEAVKVKQVQFISLCVYFNTFRYYRNMFSECIFIKHSHFISINTLPLYQTLALTFCCLLTSFTVIMATLLILGVLIIILKYNMSKDVDEGLMGSEIL